MIEIKNLDKTYHLKNTDVHAIDNVSLSINDGEVYGIIGYSGAGKSSLVRCINLLEVPDAGEITVDGVKLTYNVPDEKEGVRMCKIKSKELREARKNIGMIFQHFNLLDRLTVFENIAYPLKHIGLTKIQIEEKVNDLLKYVDLEEKRNVYPTQLSGGQKQRIAIAGILAMQPKCIIFDEPTAVLTPQEIDELMDIMRDFTKEGKSILFITHKLNEIMAVADRCTVLRKGKYIGTVNVKETTKEELSEMMVGRKVKFTVDKKEMVPGKTILEVENLSIDAKHHKKKAVKNVSFEVRQGEIVCIAGIEGNGQTELVSGITGLQKVSEGSIKFLGQDITRAKIRTRSKMGMSHIPEDRHKYGLILDYSLEENMVLQRYWEPKFQIRGFIKFKEVRKYTNKLIQEFDIRSGEGAVSIVRGMSGGNQQKAIVAREIDKNPELLVAVQPTRGLDVGAIEYIHEKIVEQRDAGKAVLLISLELDEVMNLSDRILVMYEGEIVGELNPKETTLNELGLYMAGANKNKKGENKNEK